MLLTMSHGLRVRQLGEDHPRRRILRGHGLVAQVQAKPVLVEDVLEGLVESKEHAEELAEILPGADANWAMLVARLDAAARVRQDDAIDLAVDLRKLHFFDLDSGETIGA